MKNWKEVAVSLQTSIRDALSIIDRSSLQIALVVDENDRLLGTITDGDIRRGLLKGVGLNEAVGRIYNDKPITALVDETPEIIHSIMKQKYVRQIPIIDQEGKVFRLELLREVLKETELETPVVVMAGGLGTKLHPLTEACPKPLISVGGKPVLETILENFVNQGFRNFYFSVNYKAEMIEQHFGDGSRWGITITYIHEEKRMGTAGALSLFHARPSSPIIVMNADLLTSVNFRQLLDFHNEYGSSATICIREYDFKIPYGVVQLDRHRLLDIDEKPVHSLFVNAGIYVLEPHVLDLIPTNSHYDMTDLLKALCETKKETTVFPLREYWIDIGQINDLKQANREYNENFSDSANEDGDSNSKNTYDNWIREERTP